MYVFEGRKIAENNFVSFIYLSISFQCTGSSSSSDVTIGTILNKCRDVTLVAMIATPFLKVLIAPGNFLKTSLNCLLFETLDNFFATINSDGTFQLQSAVGLRFVWNFYNVGVFKRDR